MEDKLLLTPKDVRPSFPDWKVKGVLNPAAIRLPNGKICLYVRVAESAANHDNKSVNCPIIASEKNHDGVSYENLKKFRILKKGKRVIYLKEGLFRLSTFSHFKKIILSKDGFFVEKIIDTPAFTGHYHDGDYGVEDPRITKIGKDYLMTYVSVSLNEGVSTSLAVSKDLKKWERKGIIFREQNKDVVLFPEKIKGKFVALHRPEGFFEFCKPSIWISHSPDLIHWGDEKSILQPRDNCWEEQRLGTGPPPIKTKKGWLVIYHGVRKKGKTNIYSAGAVLLDLKDPAIVLARSPANQPLIRPTKDYEKEGFMARVVFPEGIVVDQDKKYILLYCGGADDSVSVKKISLRDIFKNMKKVNPQT